MQVMYSYFLIINCIVLLLMLYDKWMAMKHQVRIPEVTLLFLSILGGAWGCLIGMKLARHKIRNKRFAWGIPLIIILQLIMYIFIIK